MINLFYSDLRISIDFYYLYSLMYSIQAVVVHIKTNQTSPVWLKSQSMFKTAKFKTDNAVFLFLS
jgi:hypothetical protein